MTGVCRSPGRRGSPRFYATAAAICALLVAACQGSTPPAPTATVTPPTATVTPPTATVTPPTTTGPTRPNGGADPSIGADGIGDDFYPQLGNGGYDVAEYHLDLTIDPREGTLNGEATITARAVHDLATFNLDLVGMTVTEVIVDGQPASFTRSGRELTVAPEALVPADTNFETVVSYGGIPTKRNAVPFAAGWQQAGDLVYVISEPDGAATWFPANDHPRDPATFTIVLTVPPGYTTVTSGVAVSGQDDPDVPDRWEIPEETAPYLVALAVGEFERTDQDPLGDIPLTIWHPPDLSPEALAVFEAQGEMIGFFSERFGPYPYPRYGALVIDDPGLPAALETQTLSTYGIEVLTLGPQLVAHELAHQWFGDSVRLDTWEDIWLNEGFATLGQWLWVEESEGSAAYRAALDRAYSLMSGEVFGDGGAAEARRRFPPPVSPAPNDLFNPSVYLRGGLALVALREEVGDETLWEILTEWHSRHAGSTATTSGFVDLVTEIGGPDAAEVLVRHLEETLVPPR